MESNDYCIVCMHGMRKISIRSWKQQKSNIIVRIDSFDTVIFLCLTNLCNFAGQHAIDLKSLLQHGKIVGCVVYILL